MENIALFNDFDLNINKLDNMLNYGESFDILKKEFLINNTRIAFYYIDGFVKSESMEKFFNFLIGVKSFGQGNTGDCEKFMKTIPLVETFTANSFNDVIKQVLSGCTAFFCEGFGKECIIIDSRSYPARETSEPENDKVMRGSRDGFVETMLFNVTMIRRRIRDRRLIVKHLTVGDESKTDVAICYLKGVADDKYVKELIEKLSKIKTDSIVFGHTSIAESLKRRNWLNPFPKLRATERPDAAAASILEGDVAVVCDNSPEVMLFPVTLFSFLQETDDFYYPPLTGSYLRIIRHIVFLLTVFITPIWYLILLNGGSLPEYFQFLIPQSPGKIPIIAQLLLVEFVIDGLKLASLNTPNTMSSSLSVVGGLLLGDFAVQIGWLCPDVILYMSFVAIANFTQSSYELGYAFKFIRMWTLILTAVFGNLGFILGLLFAIILAILNVTVDGKRRYLYPLIPLNIKDLSRLLFRLKKRD